MELAKKQLEYVEFLIKANGMSSLSDHGKQLEFGLLLSVAMPDHENKTKEIHPILKKLD